MPEAGLVEKPEVLENTPRLGLNDGFAFRCDPGKDCFGRCCHDVSIMLTPYDVLRMKKALAIDSSTFIEKYTSVMYSNEKHLPVVFLKMEPDSLKCPFLSAAGCTTYAHRPWACRMYPLGMAEPTAPEAAARRFYFVIKEELCHGHEGAPECTVRDFLAGQGVESYDASQTSFRALLGTAAEAKAALTAEQSAMYFMALYDLDRFRRFVFETRFLQLFDVDETRVEAIRKDDEELLDLAVDWLGYSLFHQRRMKLNKSAAQRAACRTEASPA
jgi:hypothetical protein